MVLCALQDNPTCTNVLDIDINSPSFSGAATYKVLPNAPPNITDPLDQRQGDWVQLTNPSMTTHATGTRNPYDVRVGLQGNVMVTVNGPNKKFGAALTGVDANLGPLTGPDPETGDAVYVDLKKVSLCAKKCGAGYDVGSAPASATGICQPADRVCACAMVHTVRC